MHTVEKLNIGIVGACGRGASFKVACDSLDSVRIHAVCDIKAEELSAAAKRLGAVEQYVDYQEMLSLSELDAVIIGTPMHLHVPHSIAALEHGLHVLCEVPAGVSVEECRRLVNVCNRQNCVYMMAENYIYMQPNVIVRELVRRGFFGTPYYAEGEYLHELKHMNEYETPWRRHWQTGIDGITYGTHSLGPILQWMPGDRVSRVCCEGTGVRHKDHAGKPYCQASSTMLCKTEQEALIKIRVDMLSDRPHAQTNYQLQGTDGAYESARVKDETHHVWLRQRSKDKNIWTNLEDLKEEFLPSFWIEHMERANKTGHGGGDYFEIYDFVSAITDEHACPIGIHETMDITLPGLYSQESIRRESCWVDVPDSRTWLLKDDEASV